MSQSSGGRAPERSSRSSISVNVTQSPAAAFGDDIADDSYSVSELSHYDEDKRIRKLGKNKKQAETFGRTTLSNYSRKDSVYPDQSGEVENGADDDDKKRASSGSHSDEQKTLSNESEEAEVPVTTFASFAKTKFQMKTPHTYACSALPQPLLTKSNRTEYLAALASWVTILRIMGDLPDVDTGDTLVVAGTSLPITSKVKSSFKTKYTKKDVEDAHKKYSDLFKDPVGTDTSTIPFLTGKADTMLDKVQMICAMGIYKPALRDELYCQLCKQLTNNPSRNSTVRGWVLLSLFAGCFTPSEKFAPSLATFLKEGPPEFSEKVDRLYRRTCIGGTRSYPPSWLEFQAAKNSKPLLVPVTFMSGHRMLCEVDAAMTVLEVIRNVSERIGLQDFTGYSLYISLHTKISCLGHGQHRILDAISECEQYTKQLGLRESNSIWRLFFRREYFTSWYNPGEDPVCTNLIYQQIRRGITMGEYRFDKEEPLMEHAAKIYYIEHPDDGVLFTEIAPFISSFISENVLDKRPKNYYEEKLKQTFDELKLGKDKPDPLQVKKEIIEYAMEKFYILFARYYDASKVTGPSLQITEVVVGVNNKGIYVVDDEDKLRLHVDFCEIVDVSKTKHHVTLGIANMEDFVFQTNHSDDFYAMLTSILEELKKRSTLAIAKQDFTQLDGPPDSTIIKGDVLELSQSMADLGSGDIVTVLCKRTNKPCDVLTSLLYMIPTVAPLDDSMLDRLTAQIRKNVASVMTGDNKTQHTLEQYARTHFRPVTESTMTKLLSKASIKRKEVECLWAYSKDALKKPLLKRTCNREDIRKLACHCFTSIQTYMSNLSINDENTNYNLCSEWILNPARRNKYLRDEIYCQIIKQLTKNPDKTNEERGWVLLTLLTSLTPPTGELQEHTFQFLYGSTHPLARECEKNLKFKRRRGGTRLYASHFLEHEMIIKQQPNVRVQVYLPSKATQTLEVTSHTRIFDMKSEVATRLKLKTFHEYSFFLTSKDRVHCLSDRAFYFDCLSHSEVYWFGSGGRRNSQANYRAPALVMLKKIWVNGQPGIDPVADQFFHFPQEMPNYLRGYHQVPEEKVIKLAGLAYRAQYDNDESHLTKLKEISPLIFPRGYLDNKEVSVVQQVLQKEMSAGWAMTPEQAKTAFLQELSSFSTYGSVFFEVKQRHIKSLPKYCLVAINYAGVHVVDGGSKSIIKSFQFETLPNWAYDDMSFTLIVAENNNTSKLLFETNVGHNMDDLLMSYVAWIMNYQMRKKHGFLGDTAGESIC